VGGRSPSTHRFTRTASGSEPLEIGNDSASIKHGKTGNQTTNYREEFLVFRSLFWFFDRYKNEWDQKQIADLWNKDHPQQHWVQSNSAGNVIHAIAIGFG
jgi:hypothetical protein